MAKEITLARKEAKQLVNALDFCSNVYGYRERHVVDLVIKIKDTLDIVNFTTIHAMSSGCVPRDAYVAKVLEAQDQFAELAERHERALSKLQNEHNALVAQKKILVELNNRSIFSRIFGGKGT